MVVGLTGTPDIVDSFHELWADVGLFEILFVLHDLEGFDVSVLVETTLVEAVVGLWQVDACQCDNITWRALSGKFASCKHFECARYMTDWHLVTRLLNLDVLV